MNFTKAQRLAVIGFAAGVISVIGAVLMTKPHQQPGGIAFPELLVASAMFGIALLLAAGIFAAAVRILRRR
jgi:uncharacterized membrane protein YedE/YeeE